MTTDGPSAAADLAADAVVDLATDAWRALRDLRRAVGGLAAHWPAVPPLLAAMDDEHLRRAGVLLERVDPDEVLAAHPGAADVRITVTGSSTLDGLRGALAAEAARDGLVARTRTSGLGEWFADLGEAAASGFAEPADLRLCVLDVHTVFDEVPTPWRVDDVTAVLGRLLARLTAVARAAEHAAREHAAREHAARPGSGGGLLVLNTVPLTARYARQLVDHASRMRLGVAWREFNAGVLRLGEQYRSVVVVDLDVLVTETGPVEDARLAAHARVHFSDEVLAGYAREVVHLARAVSGRTRKCLVVDLDGTLWGGVLGDDGAAGIRVGPSSGSEGEAFAEFGRVVRQLGSQGVLLAVCSKNDPGPVEAVLRGHPGLPLREADFVAVVASWEPKDAGITTVAKQLDLGTDSFVFADDSVFERELVRAALPEVAVVALDAEPARHAGNLLADGWFTTVELTDADRRRGADYRTQSQRRVLRERGTSLSDYLAELAVEVDLSLATADDAARVAQLTQRTNQFNLTTRRLTAADVACQVSASGLGPQPRPVAIRYRDRFGDLGIVGAAFVRRDGDVWLLDNLLLSCRVFGRGVESACVAALAEAARGAGAAVLRGRYQPTAKNARFADFYPAHGFTLVPAAAAQPASESAADRAIDLATARGSDSAAGLAGDLAADFDLDLRPAGTRALPSAVLCPPTVTVSARQLLGMFAGGSP